MLFLIFANGEYPDVSPKNSSHSNIDCKTSLFRFYKFQELLSKVVLKKPEKLRIFLILELEKLRVPLLKTQNLDIISTQEVKFSSSSEGKFVNNFIVERTIGKGSFGKVKIGIDTKTGKKYVLQGIVYLFQGSQNNGQNKVAEKTHFQTRSS